MNADQQRIEVLLRSAAATASWPPTPDLRPGVLARIAEGPAGDTVSRPSHPSRAPRRVVLVRGVLAAILALVVLAGVATALGYRLPGLDILFVERLAPAGTGFELGTAIPLAEVRDGEPPRVLVPAALPVPESAFVLGAGARRIVTLAWRAAAGEPAIPGTDLAMAITAVPGRTDEGFLTKMLGPASTIRAVDVAGDRGWWISGAPHDLLVARPDGTVGMVKSRLAGDTLVFVRDGTLYRLESGLGLDRTLEVAESLR